MNNEVNHYHGYYCIQLILSILDPVLPFWFWLFAWTKKKTTKKKQNMHPLKMLITIGLMVTQLRLFIDSTMH